MRFFVILLSLDRTFSLKLHPVIACGRVKTHEKNLGPKFEPNRPKWAPKLDFLSFSQVWFISFPLNGTWRISNHYCFKKLWKPTALKQAQNEVFRDFIECGSYFFLEIEYDDSLRQCLISSRRKTYENFWGPKLGSTWGFLPCSKVLLGEGEPSKLSHFHSPWNFQETIGFLTI